MNPDKTQHTQHGLTLIEVLVALAILAFGVLGVTALQMHGLRNVKVSGDLQLVTRSVHELAELVRLNRDNADDYVGLDGDTSDGGTACGSPPVAQPSATVLANRDFCDVLSRMYDEMPSYDLAVSVSTVGTTYTILTEWSPRQTYGSAVSVGTVSYAMDLQL